MATVELKKVSKVYESRAGRLNVLTGIDLEIEDGEFLCVVGPSGCGKSTLLNLLAGFERPSSGEIQVSGKQVTGPSPSRFVIFQEPALFPWLNVYQNIVFGLRMAGVDLAEQQEKAQALLKAVHLSKFAHAWVTQISGGMKQRVAIARALAMDPDILLMDEPFAALDAQTRDMLHEVLEEVYLQTRKTIVFVTHNVREAVRLGSRVILMSGQGGEIIEQFPVNLPRNRYLEDVEVVTIASRIRDRLRQEVLRTSGEGGADA
ncbi:ABC transporter ATP-binding protein [Geobacter pelophilus]|uniref:ABC transporter ATP-binding protein n=1 Tax=Geoanaerobacter pelophilus TaxID=60036 RepID=A0AAW4L0R4_9BACT|nr:ABC transporter ATP-binding protein [Geoanaerobacter pelophilus]MBT0663390.1 ABC transporter ATP-binding protein [Geoanaerobacter pelophilus]